MDNEKTWDHRRIATSLLLVGYLVIRFVFTQWLDSLGSYSSYIFELALIAIVFGLYRQDHKKIWLVNKALSLIAVGALISGFGVFKIAGVMQIQIPFSLSEGLTIFFLLVVAPILEESIFRFFAWKPLAAANNLMALIGTSLLFSYSHFHSFWFLPEEIHPFIYYQTIYTLLLGAVCGYSLWKYNSLFGAIVIHFAFNLYQFHMNNRPQVNG